MLMIRLRRGGAKHNPIYRVVVSDSRQRPTSKYVEQVGFYNPHTDPPEIRVDMEKIEETENNFRALVLSFVLTALSITGSRSSDRRARPRFGARRRSPRPFSPLPLPHRKSSLQR